MATVQVAASEIELLISLAIELTNNYAIKYLKIIGNETFLRVRVRIISHF